MIKSFRHDGLERFYRTGSKAGIKPKHAKRLTAQLTILEVATRPARRTMTMSQMHNPAHAGEVLREWLSDISVTDAAKKEPRAAMTPADRVQERDIANAV